MRFSFTGKGRIAVIGGGAAVVSAVVALAAFAAATPKVGDIAPDFTLNDLGGKKVTLSALTKKTPVALVVLRGFPGYQCPICTMQVGELMANSDKIKAAGNMQVLLVYPGPSAELQKRASEFVSGKNLPANFHLVIDPDYKVVNQYGLRWDAPRETAYPSTFVVGKGGKITFAKVSRSHMGRANSGEIVAAAK